LRSWKFTGGAASIAVVKRVFSGSVPDLLLAAARAEGVPYFGRFGQPEALVFSINNIRLGFRSGEG
jgi:hypothetical protein